jgi:hypothetical protein
MAAKKLVLSSGTGGIDGFVDATRGLSEVGCPGIAIGGGGGGGGAPIP